ncbi:MAG: hypothetical protein H3C51_12330 [Rubellimicrobium sp.]|nr:hypothetical protein [Rubellimicrobium sp.]
MWRLSFILAPALAACAGFPELDARLDDADRNAPWPALVPVAPLLAEAGAPGATASGDLDARLAALRARADALRAR